MHSPFRTPEGEPIGVGQASAEREAIFLNEAQISLYRVKLALRGLSGLLGDTESGAVSHEEVAALVAIIADRVADTFDRVEQL